MYAFGSDSHGDDYTSGTCRGVPLRLLAGVGSQQHPAVYHTFSVLIHHLMLSCMLFLFSIRCLSSQATCNPGLKCWVPCRATCGYNFGKVSWKVWNCNFDSEPKLPGRCINLVLSLLIISPGGLTRKKHVAIKLSTATLSYMGMVKGTLLVEIEFMRRKTL